MNNDIFYGVVIVLVLVSIFGFTMWFTTYQNMNGYKDSLSNYVSKYNKCNTENEFLIKNVTGIKNTHDYLTKVYNYTDYLIEKDKRPCNCTDYNSTLYSIKLQDDYTISVDRDIFCGGTKYHEMIVYSYLAPMLTNWSSYTPSEFCIKAGR